MATDLREIEGIFRDPQGYVDTIDSLVAILATANSADSGQAPGWLRPGDANQRDGLYGDIYDALVRVAGQDFVDRLAQTGEAEISLARRDIDGESIEDAEDRRLLARMGDDETAKLDAIAEGADADELLGFDEFHAYHECPACEYSTGPDGVLGQLGSDWHVRCRACGHVYISHVES